MGLSAFDDKRFLLEDGIHTLAYGHKDITASVVDDEVGQPPPVISHGEAVSKGAVQRQARDPFDVQHRPSLKEKTAPMKVSSSVSEKERVLEELGFEASGEEESDGEDEFDAQDNTAFSSDSSDDEADGWNRSSNSFILSGCRVAPSTKRKTPRTVHSKRTATALHDLPTSTCYLDPLHMLAPSPPPICPPSPRTPSPPPAIFTNKRIRLTSDSD